MVFLAEINIVSGLSHQVKRRLVKFGAGLDPDLDAFLMVVFDQQGISTVKGNGQVVGDCRALK